MFELPEGSSAKIKKWLEEEVYPPILEQQKKDPNISMFIFVGDDGIEHPYEGAIGGGLTYSFTPTSLGTVTTVSYGDKTLDLTEYDTW